MTNLKQSRWVKVHAQGDANYAEAENVMNVLVGENRSQAEAAYTVRSFKKAAYWMLKYLEYAEAKNLCERIREPIETAVAEANREAPGIELNGDDWKCYIERLARGEFKVRLEWKETKTTEAIMQESEARPQRRRRKSNGGQTK